MGDLQGLVYHLSTSQAYLEGQLIYELQYVEDYEYEECTLKSPPGPQRASIGERSGKLRLTRRRIPVNAG